MLQVTIDLTRRDLSVLLDNGENLGEPVENGETLPEEEEKEEAKKKTLPWHRNLKRGKKAKKATKGAGIGKNFSNKKVSPSSDQGTRKEEESESDVVILNSDAKKLEESESASEVDENEAEVNDSDKGESEEDEKSVKDSFESEKNDDLWEKLQSDAALKRRKLLEGKSNFSRPVHCPYYPIDKQEYWWAYITNRKREELITPVFYITNLAEHEEIQLKFTAPPKPGHYTFGVHLRSDSYLGFDQVKEIKVIEFSSTFLFNKC